MRSSSGKPKTSSSGNRRIELRLYVAGTAPNSQKARANVTDALGSTNGTTATLTVIDVFERPDLALQDEVYVTPMLIRVRPEPRRVVGTLSDREALLELLRECDRTREP